MSDCFYQAGQVCTAGERVLVHERIHDEFVEKLTAKVAELKVGDPLDESTDMGPLSDGRILDKVVRHVEDARAKGATIVTGGNHDGLFYEPTILTGVTTDMEIAQEETFGPVAPVIKISERRGGARDRQQPRVRAVDGRVHVIAADGMEDGRGARGRAGERQRRYQRLGAQRAVRRLEEERHRARARWR